MYLPLGTYSPDIKLGLVSASRNCFPRALSEERTNRLLERCRAAGISPFIPKGDCRIIETKTHAAEAARQFKEAKCDAVVYYLGNFSGEIEDAVFIKARDFETCNYNLASVNSIGIEVEELGLFDLQNEVRRIKEQEHSDGLQCHPSA